MRRIVLLGLVITLAGSGWVPVCAARAVRGPLSVDLGDIPGRPVPPPFSFDRFFETRQLRQLEFAPDNRSVYFIRNDGKVDNVFAIDLASRSMRQITGFDESVAEFLVSHDGRFLIIAHDVAGNEGYDLYRFDLGSGDIVRLTEAGEGDTTMVCGLSPDDELLYYAQTQNNRSEAGLWQIDLHSGEVRELLPGKGRTFDCDTVSRDGRYLLFGELIGFDTRHLGLLDLANNSIRTVVDAPGINNVDGHFAGDSVYFRSALASDRFRLWRYRMGDGQLQNVPLPFDNDLAVFSMHADGRVAVVGYRSEFTARSAVFVDGFDAPVYLGLPAEAVLGAVFSDTDPELGVVFSETANMPRRYYLVGGERPTLLYDANQSGIDNCYLSKVRSVWIPSFDGLEIPVHLFIPNGTSRKNPRPALFFIHGGPDEHVDPLYIAELQFLANRGYIVVVPNVRGSTGFGKRFASLDSGDWGGGHIRDIVEVAAAVRTLDFVDADNLFIAGASFGGFSVMSLATQYPRVFRAAVDFFGFTELATFVDGWPVYLQRHLSLELGFDPRVDPERNRALSPLYHVDRIEIPLQIHQGANDSRVPRTQSDRLVAHLRRRGQVVDYFVYHDEGHGFTRLENERTAWERVVRFLRRQQPR
ncbi:S9 family peptidase [Thiogranum longum]